MCKFILTSLTAGVHGVFHIILQDGSLVRQYKGASGIFEVCWSKAGDKLAACYSNNTVSVLLHVFTVHYALYIKRPSLYVNGVWPVFLLRQLRKLSRKTGHTLLICSTSPSSYNSG